MRPPITRVAVTVPPEGGFEASRRHCSSGTAALVDLGVAVFDVRLGTFVHPTARR